MKRWQILLLSASLVGAAAILATAQVGGGSGYGLQETLSQSQGDTRYVNVTGDALTGPLDLDGYSLTITRDGSALLKGDRAAAVGDSEISFFTTLDGASVDETALRISYNVNKLGVGADRGLVINQIDTASPGTSYLIDAQVGGTSKFSCDNTGNCVSSVRFNSADIYSSGTGRFSTNITTLNSGAYYSTGNGYKTIITSSGTNNGCGADGACIDLQKKVFVGDGSYQTYEIDSVGDLYVEDELETGGGVLMTSVGGLAFRLKNSSSTLGTGTVVSIDSATDASFVITPAGSLDFAGVIIHAACTRGATCFLTSAGVAWVKTDANGATRGSPCRVSPVTNGAMDCTADGATDVAGWAVQSITPQ